MDKAHRETVRERKRGQIYITHATNGLSPVDVCVKKGKKASLWCIRWCSCTKEPSITVSMSSSLILHVSGCSSSSLTAFTGGSVNTNVSCISSLSLSDERKNITTHRSTRGKPSEIIHLATWVYLILPFTEWFACASLSLSLVHRPISLMQGARRGVHFTLHLSSLHTCHPCKKRKKRRGERDTLALAHFFLQASYLSAPASALFPVFIDCDVRVQE